MNGFMYFGLWVIMVRSALALGKQLQCDSVEFAFGTVTCDTTPNATCIQDHYLEMTEKPPTNYHKLYSLLDD